MRPQCLGSQFAPMAARYRSCSSKDIAHVRVVWLVGDWKSLAYFAVRGRTGQVAPGAAGYGPRSSRGLRTCAAQCLGSQFAVRGRTGQVAPGAAGLWLVLIERVVYVRGVWLVGDWKGLAMGGVWPGAVHLGWSKSPRWMGARRCAGVPCQAGRGGNRSGPNCFLVSFAQKLDAKNTGIPVKQRERHFAVILVEQGKQFSCILQFLGAPLDSATKKAYAGGWLEIRAVFRASSVLKRFFVEGRG